MPASGAVCGQRRRACARILDRARPQIDAQTCAREPDRCCHRFFTLASRPRRTSTRLMKQNEAEASDQPAFSMEENMKVIQKTKIAAVVAALGLTVGLGTAASAQPHGPGGGEHGACTAGSPGLASSACRMSSDRRSAGSWSCTRRNSSRSASGSARRVARRSEAVMAVPVDEARGPCPERGTGEGRSRRGRPAGEGARGGLQRAHPGAAGEGEGAARGTRGSVGSSAKSERQGGQPSRRPEPVRGWRCRPRRLPRASPRAVRRSAAHTSRTPWLRTRK